jgi:hypothetical protein
MVRDTVARTAHTWIINVHTAYYADDPTRGAYVKGLSEVAVVCPEDALDILMRGIRNRTVGATAANEQSSRSHSIFRIVVESRRMVPAELLALAEGAATGIDDDDADVTITSDPPLGAASMPATRAVTPARLTTTWGSGQPVKVRNIASCEWLFNAVNLCTCICRFRC